MPVIPTVIEADGRAERAFDIYSRLLRDRIVFLGREVDDEIANLIVAQLLLLEAAPDDVWEALTDEAQLEEWFANEVELDPTPGGRGVFRWDNGEVREAVVEAVEEGSRIVLRFDDDGVVDLRVEPAESGSRVLVREESPSWSTSLELYASALCMAR